MVLLSKSTATLNQNRSFHKATGREMLPLAISQVAQEQCMEAVPLSNDVDRDPEITYTRQQIANPHTRGSACSIKGYAKLPDDFLAGKDETSHARCPIKMRNSATDTAHQSIVNEHQAKETTFVGMINAQGAGNRKEKDNTGASGYDEPAAIRSGSVEVTTNTAGADCTTTIISESAVTDMVIACGDITFKVTVNTDRKFSFTQKRLPNTYTPRYVIRAPVNVKIVLKDPVSSNSAVIDEHS